MADTYKLKVDLPSRPQGDKVEVPPYGWVENGSTIDIQASQEDAERLSRSYGLTVLDGSGKVVAQPKPVEPGTGSNVTKDEGGEE